MANNLEMANRVTKRGDIWDTENNTSRTYMGYF